MDLAKYFEILYCEYKTFVRNMEEDFKANSNILEIIQKIHFDRNFNFKEWLSNPDFTVHMTDVFNREVPSIADLEQLDCKFKYFDENQIDDNYFFGFKEFKYKEEANEFRSNHQYLMTEKYYNKIQKLILCHLPNFKKKTGNRYLNKVDEDFVLELDFSYKYKSDNGLYQYRNPESYLLINKESYNLNIDDIGVCHFFKSDHITYFFGWHYERANNPGLNVYYDKSSKVYRVSNDITELKAFNKYLLLILEVFIHCQKLLNTFVEENLIPKLKIAL